MTTDPAIRDHQTWLGYIQPDGLVVSAAALVDSQVYLDRGTMAVLQEDFLCLVDEVDIDGDEATVAISDLKDFLLSFLGWPEDCIVGLKSEKPIPDELTVPLPEFGETLKPSFAFVDPKSKDPSFPWLLLVQEVATGKNMDVPFSNDLRGWSASPSRRFERLLRETGVSIGLISNGINLRLIYAPRGENAGSLTFPVSAMTEVAGRLILAAFYLLFNMKRFLTGPSEARLPALLAKSRDYQSAVSTALAEQVLAALYELLRGFQTANEHTKGELLRDVLANDPNSIYAGLLSVLMRLVFLLYAEDRGLLPDTSLYQQHYSIHGLFKKLREDHERYPDTMDHRYGAWPRLLALFRSVYDGCSHEQLKMPPRHGHLFDPSRFPFLEGQSMSDYRLPLISDGVVYRVLNDLLILDGERLSYRTLDVEQIGSVYETMMGFKLELAHGTSIAVKASKKHGAAVVIDLETLLSARPKERVKYLSDVTDQKFAGEAAKGIEGAQTLDGILAALERKIARNATPHVVPKGSMILQPSDERRRSGSHYTPRSLTEPIVRTALRPILERLGERPAPQQILDLKVCDIAVGSGAFLVEACRQLGDELVKAWHNSRSMPTIPPDEDEILLARRLIAQRCLYGVDKNPMAADLAKLSLWLMTLAKDHPFTFLDHSVKSGDSLVGLTKQQIAAFHWEANQARFIGQQMIEEKLNTVMRSRQEILDGGDNLSPEAKSRKLEQADQSLNILKETGDLCIAAFFRSEKDKGREELRKKYLSMLTEGYKNPLALRETKKITQKVRSAEDLVVPFHWEIEFPEVFNRENSGFDAIVGNPPFMGGKHISSAEGRKYVDWLIAKHHGTDGNADLVAHFFRAAFSLIHGQGCFGLIATNTIGQGDTRAAGLGWICNNNGTIYSAIRRYKWPGQAAVIVSIVHIKKGKYCGERCLDSRYVERITAYLFHKGGSDNPGKLSANQGQSFIGSIVLGMGFTFDDTDTKGVATPINEMHKLINSDPRNAERIFPYIGGEELNESPTHSPHRYVINFGEMSETEARQWPDLMRIVEEKVWPDRKGKPGSYSRQWWLFGRRNQEGQRILSKIPRVMALCRVSPHLSVTFLPNRIVFAESIVAFALPDFSAFCVMQSRVHETWARFFSSSLKDDLRYSPTDCFETFPFPLDFGSNAALKQTGQEYYEFRAALMIDKNEGLTKIYNRFHDPNETSLDIIRLRDLHRNIDRAVLGAYGWSDISTDCKFTLEYEEDEDKEDGPRKKKKPWRYRWPDDVRDEVLARLLAQNAERAEEERLAGLTASVNGDKKRRGRKKSPGAPQSDRLL